MDTVATKGGVLLLTDDASVPVASVLSSISDVGYEGIGEDNVHVVPQASQLKQLSIESAAFDIVIFIPKLGLLKEQLLEEIARVLKPGGTILTQISVDSTEVTDKTRSVPERKLLLAGFLEVEALEKQAFLPSDAIRVITIKAKKASWTIGSSFSIKKTTKMLPKIHIDDELDLIDEDSLLTEEDLKKPPLPSASDCETGSTRKACKNCMCGRAEAEEKVQKLGLTADLLNNPQSACGSCGLGDAFRCSTCPYKGLPPFKVGEKVTLSGNFLLTDI